MRAAGHGLRRRPHDLLAAVDRRRPGGADPGAADLDRDRHHRHARRDRQRHEPRRRRRGPAARATRGRCSSPPACSARSASCRACRSCRSCCSSAILAALAFGIRNRQRDEAARPGRRSRPPRRRRRCRRRPTRSRKSLTLDTLELEIGYGLIPLVDEERGRRAAEARRPGPQADGVGARPGACSRSASATTCSSARTSTPSAQGLRGRARPAGRRLPAGDEPGRRRPRRCRASTPSSRRSGCPRCGSPRAPASRPRRRATPSSTTPRS